MTSHDVVGYVRKTLKTKKVGHTGTLDPGVAGVLPIAVGKATKAIQYLQDDKMYRCEAILGMSTDTQDIYGKTIDSKGSSGVTEESILKGLEKFKGDIFQRPPMYSAIKIGGKKLYQIARQGNNIEVPMRKINIKEISPISIQKKDNFYFVMFDIYCQKGTYVRTICHDLGQMLGCGGTMSFLIRTKSGIFNIDDAITLEQLWQEAENCHNFAVSIDKALPNLDAVKVDDSQLLKLQNGIAISYHQETTDNLVKILSEYEEVIGIGEFIWKKEQSKTLLKIKKSLI